MRMQKQLFFALTVWRLGGACVRRAAMTLTVMLMTAATAWAQEHSGTTDDGLTWELTQDGNGNYTVLTITGTGDMKNYGYMTVDNIWKTNAPWGYDITSVTIGDGVTSIGDYAFIGCVNLASVTIGSGVTSIGIGAINHCDQMTTVTLPASVTIIAYAAFENCQALQTVYIQHDGAVSLTGSYDNQFNAPYLQYIFFPSASAADANSEGNWARYADNKRVTIYSTSTSWAGDYLVTTNVTISSTISVTANTTLTIADGMTLTASNGIAINAGATLTVDGNGTLIAKGTDGSDGDSGHANGYDGVAGIDGNLIVNGGTVNATGGTGGKGGNSRDNAGLGGAGINGSLTVNGGIVTVSGGSGGAGGKGYGYEGIDPNKGGNGGNGGNGGAGISDALTVNGGTVNTYGGSGGVGGKKGSKKRSDGSVGSAGRGLGGTVTSSSATAYIQESSNNSTWSNMTSDESTKQYVRVIEPIDVTLADNASNADAITENNGQFANVTLAGRTLYKDGAWNTLCLPFNVTVGSGQMEGATAMRFDGETSGFVASTGVLTLNFTSVNEGSIIAAGTPFIVKWTGEDVSNPVFSGVTVSSTAAATTTDDSEWVDFCGTYSPEVIYESSTEKTKLYLGGGNTLYYPTTEGFKVNSCRAYFVLKNGLTVREDDDSEPGGGHTKVRAFSLTFGDEDEATGILSTTDDTDFTDSVDAWYDLSGRKLSGKPSQRGVYIHGGRKVAIQ